MPSHGQVQGNRMQREIDREWDDEDYHEEKHEKTEWEMLKEDDDERRYREWESDRRDFC